MAASRAATKPQKRANSTASAKRAVKKVTAKKAAATKKRVSRTAAPEPKKAAAAKKAAPARARAAAKKPAAATKAPAKRGSGRATPQAPGWHPAERTAELVDVLGGVNALARILGVSPSQPSRWKSGKEVPSPEVARLLLDLDHVVARAQLVWHRDVVPVWLESANGHLGGQTPLGVLLTRGPNEVLTALSATEAGGFA